MYHKILETLPRDRFPDWADHFDRYSETYKNAVDLAKKCCSGDRAIIVTDSNQVTQALEKMLAQGSTNAQVLLELEPYQTKYGTKFIKLPRSVDIITALYVPTYVCWLKLISPLEITIFNRCSAAPETPIDIVLANAKNVPGSNCEVEQLLELSRTERSGFVHTCAQFMHIDGVEYQRIIFAQPMYPIVSIAMQDTTIQTDTPCKIYAECSVVDNYTRLNMMINPGIVWFETDAEIRLAEVHDGFCMGGIFNDYDNTLIPTAIPQAPDIHVQAPPLQGIDQFQSGWL